MSQCVADMCSHCSLGHCPRQACAICPHLPSVTGHDPLGEGWASDLETIISLMGQKSARWAGTQGSV